MYFDDDVARLHFKSHRSSESYPVKLARMLEDASEKTSATLIHVAASGAQLSDGVLASYAGMEGTEPMLPQLEQVAFLTGRLGTSEVRRERVDAFIMTVGANDGCFACAMAGLIARTKVGKTRVLGPYLEDIKAGFENGDWESILREREYFGVAEALQPHWRNRSGAQSLNNSFGLFAERLASFDIPYDSLLLVGYPDMTIGPQGRCTELFDELDWSKFGTLMDAEEIMWIDHHIRNPLNTLLRGEAEARSELGWKYLAGAEEALVGVGLCAPENRRAANHLPLTSLRLQGTQTGIAHPNVRGHDKIANALFDETRSIVFEN